MKDYYGFTRVSHSETGGNTIIAGDKSQDDLKSILSIKDPSRCISQLRARKAALEKELKAFEEAISGKEKELREEMDA